MQYIKILVTADHHGVGISSLDPYCCRSEPVPKWNGFGTGYYSIYRGYGHNRSTRRVSAFQVERYVVVNKVSRFFGWSFYWFTDHY